MLMHLHATSAEQFFNIVFTEERGAYLEASASTEGPVNVVDANDCVSNDMMIVSKHAFRDLVHWHDLAWANLGVVHLNAVAQEELVHLFDVCAGAKDAFVAPVVFQVVAANPLIRLLIHVCQCGLEAVLVRQCFLKLSFRYKRIAE